MFRWWERRRPPPAEALVGWWKLVRRDGDLDIGDGVTLIFAADGTLTSMIHDGAHDRIARLVYRVTGHVLVTQESSQPGEERTRWHFEDSGHLVLDYGPHRLWFIRIPEQSR